MSDKATMLRETVEAFTDLRAMFDELTEDQASRIWLGVLGVRDVLIRTYRPETLPSGGHETSGESIRKARDLWTPGSFWGRRYPSPREDSTAVS